ncbi:SipW-dependent-type signal peptide-containing protein [Williamsia sp. R60]
MSLTVTKRNRRKIRAILAAGLVLGVGAAVTLAAWSDSVWGQSEFATDKWNVQGSFNGGTSWGEFATGPTAGTFTFPLADATSLTPGESVKAPVSLRVGPATSALNASVTLAPSGNTSALAGELELTVTEAASCSVAGTTPAGWPAGGSVATAGGSTPIILNGDMTPRHFCFTVTLPADAALLDTSTTGQVLWEFKATSVEP